MKNIDYLEEFFRKHNLSGQILVNYDDPYETDLFMSTITFENGDVISINDVRFDIDSQLEPDVVDQWLKQKRIKDISLMNWIASPNNYVPTDVDYSSVEEYKEKMTKLADDVNEHINKVFELKVDTNIDDDE